MTNIEFKVQFVSGSFGGKGSCKGIVLWGGGTWRAKGGVEGLDVRAHVAGSARVISSQLASKEAGRVAMTRSRLGPLEAAHNGHPGPTHISYMRSGKWDNEKGSLCVVLAL